MLKIILAAVILIALALLGLGVRLLFDRKAEFRGGSCKPAGSVDSGYGCACGGACEVEK